MGDVAGTASVLFTDVVNSTELRTALGEQGADALGAEHDRLCREAVAKHGGTVVKGLGDGVMATFSAAADAVGAAKAIQQAVHEHGRRATSYAVRVGISAGDISYVDGDCFGMPVVEAARLCAAAEPGQVLVAEPVRWLARGRGGHVFTQLGTRELKGLPEPVLVSSVAWEPAQNAWPLPAVLSTLPSVSLVGRDAECGALRAAYKQADSGNRQFVLIAGEPGVGKTRLAIELARHVHSDGGLVLAGRCDEELAVPYQPFAEALAGFVDAVAERPQLLGASAGELVGLLPSLAQRIPGLPERVRSDPETERYRLFGAVTEWLDAVAAEQPVLLVLDDLHWATKPTLLLLRHVIRSGSPDRICVVATYRDTDVDRTHPLGEMLGDFRREPAVQRIAVRGLDLDGVIAYLEAASGDELDEDGHALAVALHTQTEGNPLFVNEVLRHLRETGVLYHDGTRWTTDRCVDDFGIPEGIREVVGRRLSRLTDETNEVLRQAAVIGQQFTLPVLQRVVQLPDDDVFDALEQAEAARLIQPLPGAQIRYAFAHALVRATLYDELPTLRRLRLHKAVGDAIEAAHVGNLDAVVADLAHHFGEAAAVGGLDQAVVYTLRAAEQALAQYADTEALRLYRHVLEFLDVEGQGENDEARREALIGLGIAQQHTGDAAHRETLLEAGRLAHDAGDVEREVRAALANSRGYWSNAGTVDADRVAALEAALESVGDGDSPERARLLVQLAGELMYVRDRRDDRFRMADEALHVARRLNDPETVARVQAQRVAAIFDISTLDERLRAHEEMHRIAQTLNDPALLFSVHVIWHMFLLEAAEPAEAAQRLTEARAIADRLGQPTMRWMLGHMDVIRLTQDGRLNEAEALLEQTFALGQECGQPDAFAWYGVQLARLRIEQGRLGELADVLLMAAEQMPGSPGWLAVATEALAANGDRNPARQLLDRFAAEGFDFPRDLAWSFAIAECVGACDLLGASEHAPALYALLEPYRGRLVSVGIALAGAVDHALGVLARLNGQPDLAAQHFRDALQIHRRAGMPLWEARSAEELAALSPGRTVRA